MVTEAEIEALELGEVRENTEPSNVDFPLIAKAKAAEFLKIGKGFNAFVGKLAMRNAQCDQGSELVEFDKACICNEGTA